MPWVSRYFAVSEASRSSSSTYSTSTLWVMEGILT
jgi:hypothetical protein